MCCVFDRVRALSIVCLSLPGVYAIRPAQLSWRFVTFVAPKFKIAFKRWVLLTIVRDGYDVCSGNVFQSLLTVFGCELRYLRKIVR